MKHYGRTSLYRSSTEELSLMVFNDFSLYTMRHERRLWSVLRQSYQFTKAQAAELKADLIADKEEMARFEASQVKAAL